MSSNPLLAAAVILVAFTAGWFIGRTTTMDIAHEARLSALQAEVAALREVDPSAPDRPAARPAARAAAADPSPSDVKDVEIAGAPMRGPEDAPVTIVEFSDFQCPYCSRVTPTLERVMNDYDGKVRLAFRQFPLTNIHPMAQKAAEASLCAHEQEKFWAMHDAMFADQGNLGVDALKSKAGELGLDAEQFAACLDSGKYAEEVSSDMKAGQAAGVSGTPAMFINGRFISGAVPYEQVAEVIDDELQRSSQGGE